MGDLCDREQIRKSFDYIGRFTEAEVDSSISEESDMVYTECGRPIEAIKTDIDSSYRKYYLGESNIYRIDNLYIGTALMSEISSTCYLFDKNHGIVRLKPVASSGPDLTNKTTLICHYVPKIYNKYCALRVARELCEESDTTSGNKISKQLNIIQSKVDRVERYISERMGVVTSSQNTNYDDSYKLYRKYMVQDFANNEFIFDEP